MRMTTNMTAISALLLGLALGGCPSDNDGTAATDDDTMGPAPELPSNLPANCVVDFEHFRTGLTAASDDGGFMIRIEDADNIPATKYENDWTIAIVDAQGNAMTDAKLMKVWPFMPAHMHGSQTTTVIEDLGQGTFQVDKIDLWMDGGWEVHFEVDVSGQTSEAVVDVCIPK